MPSVAREREMTVSKEALRKAILDFAGYPKFLPEVVSAKERSGGTPQATFVDFELEIIKRFQYTLVFDFHREDEIHWRLHEGKIFKRNQGRWVFKPGPKNLLAIYELDVELGLYVPGWVTKKLTENNLPRLLENYETRAKEM
jgi:ribosome-associated toxin RatA of RatAB toxin-antitoxin module